MHPRTTAPDNRLRGDALGPMDPGTRTRLTWLRHGGNGQATGRLGSCSMEYGVPSGDPYAWTESDHGPFEFGAAVAPVRGCSPRGRLKSSASGGPSRWRGTGSP